MIEGLNEVIKADSARSTKVDCTASVEEYVNKSDWRINANSNTGYSHAGLINNLAGKVIANFWLDKVYTKAEGDAHRNGDYHIHDLDNLAPYCFTGDTKIKVRLERNSDNLERSLEWLSGYKTVFYVCTVDNNGKTVWSRANKCRQTRITNVIKLTFNNDEKNTVRCTPDHKFKLVDGTWVEAKDLISDMNLLTVNREEYHVTNIEKIKEPQHVYCLEELDTGTHSFALQNGVVVHNCCGHDLQKLLDEGFNGVPGRISSRAPKHFREALYQMANFIGILQAEWAGAQAFSSFDTYLAPLCFYDMYANGLTEGDIKKAIRNFVYNLNVPSRWGQCVPESYRCLKADGTWVNHKDLKIGDEIYVVDMETGKLKKDTITHINLFDAPEKMHKYYNEHGFNFRVTTNHRVINRTGSNPWRISESEDLIKLKGPIHIPVSSWSPMTPEEYMGYEYDISDELLELFAFIITDGCIQKQEGKSPRLEWYKSTKRWGAYRFEEICDILGITYHKDKRENHGFEGSVGYRYRLHKCEATDKVIEMLNGDKHKVPEFIKYLSPRQCNIILDIWSQTDGFTGDGKWKMQADTHEIQEMLAYMAIKVGKAVSIDERLIGTNKNATIYTHLYVRGSRCCQIEEVDSECEKVWCPTTNTGTFVCMTDEGYVFLTGNSPFSNVTIDWTVPEILKDKVPTRNGENFFISVIAESEKKQIPNLENMYNEIKHRLGDLACEDVKLNLMGVTYSLFQKEMNVINRCFYEILNEGDMNGQPFTFPIPTINITEDFDWYGENTDLLFENAAKYGSSYFQNFIGSQYMIDERGNKVRDPKAYSPKDLRSMCCRLSLDLKALRKKGGGLFGSDAQTGSIGVVTINCARLGYLHKGDEKELYKALDKLLNMAKSTLEKKRKVVTEFYDRGLYPYTRRYLPNKYDSFFSTIGVNGMNEMIRNFTNDEHDITDEYGQEMVKKVLLHIREKLTIWQQETGNLYNLEATPAEGTCYRLCNEDKKRYKDIIHAGTDEEPYYTNSSQLPVDFTNDAFEALDLQDELQKMYTGGTVLHLYMNERISNAEAARQLVKKVLTNYRLPYISITPSFSVCPIHGYIKGHHEFCPKCDRELMNKHAEEIDFNS